jgi:lipid II:glycine glycyltransferase (peptidoglycan interpeptide bridge formation enzyme)
MAQIRLYKIPLINSYLGYVQFGPLIRKENTIFNIKKTLNVFKKFTLNENISVLKITPYIFQDEYSKFYIDALNESGFIKNKKTDCYFTAILDLRKSKDDIFKKLHRSWRRYLIKAEKNNLYIETGTDKYYWDILKKLYSESKQRKGFKGLDPNTFSEAQCHLPTNSKIDILVAKDSKKDPVCAHATSYLGETALGVIAASNDKGLKMNASHLIWWHTLINSKNKGALYYDLGGIDPINNSSVYKFKMKMGSEEKKCIGTFDYFHGIQSRFINAVVDIVKK